MRILAIEASTAEGSAAIVVDDVIESEVAFPAPRGRGSKLFVVLAAAVQEAGTLDAIVVGTGPGSYNGLRASIAAAWGLARARGIPLYGVNSVLGYDAEEYFVLGDARSGEWFFAHIVSGRLRGSIDLLEPDIARERLPNGALVFSANHLLDVPSLIVQSPAAAQLAAKERMPPLPIYLKPPHITQPRKKKPHDAS